MIKVAIFVEGQGELIFVRRLLSLLVPYDALSFECLSLSGDDVLAVPWECSNPSAAFRFSIINVGNDERVLTVIAEREEGLVNRGYELIIALRDMYCEAYCKRSHVVDQTVNSLFIERHEATINERMTNPECVCIFFAIMELEAWLLGMYELFSKIDPILTCDYVETELGFDLRDTDPQTQFFRPAVKLGNVLGLAGFRYTKSKQQMESILSHLDLEDVCNAVEEGRCRSFASFLDELRSLIAESNVFLEH